MEDMADVLNPRYYDHLLSDIEQNIP